MLSTARNTTPPDLYSICTSETCPKRNNCLRALIAPEALKEKQFYMQINRSHPSHREGEGCKFFQSEQPERYAFGFSKAMNSLSHTNYDACTRYLTSRFSKSTFYRKKGGRLPISPAEQEELRSVLLDYGYNGDMEAIFDRYELLITWE